MEVICFSSLMIKMKIEQTIYRALCEIVSLLVFIVMRFASTGQLLFNNMKSWQNGGIPPGLEVSHEDCNNCIIISFYDCVVNQYYKKGRAK
jgi:hypothetical protein